MSRNLFTADLADITYEDISSFLCMEIPVEQRPREGIRCDWKGDVPPRLGEMVTAFANTIGGLLFIGVEEGREQTKGFPVLVPGIRRSKGELRTRLTQMITTTVSPPPSFSIGV